MSLGLGKLRAAPMKSRIPLALLRPMALYLPFPKGKAKTLPELLATGTYDFNAERVRFHTLIERPDRCFGLGLGRHHERGSLTTEIRESSACFRLLSRLFGGSNSPTGIEGCPH